MRDIEDRLHAARAGTVEAELVAIALVRTGAEHGALFVWDKQAGGLSIRELERIRNENLVGILQSLKAGGDGEGWGAGKLLAEFEERLRAS